MVVNRYLQSAGSGPLGIGAAVQTVGGRVRGGHIVRCGVEESGRQRVSLAVDERTTERQADQIDQHDDSEELHGAFWFRLRSR